MSRDAETTDISEEGATGDSRRRLRALRTEADTRAELTDLQEVVSDSLTEKERDSLNPTGIKKFFEGIFGKESAIASFFTSIISWFADKIGAGTKQLSDEEVFGAVEDVQRKIEVEHGVVAHRARTEGYFDRPNSKEAIEAALTKGETELEVDIRLHGDTLILRHDPIDDTSRESMQQITTLEEIIPLLQQHPKVTLFADIKGGAKEVKRVAELLKQVDARDSSNLLSRLVIMGFNPAVIEAANEHLPNAPQIFLYFPTGAYRALESTLLPLLKKQFLSKNAMVTVLKGGDMLGKSNLGGNLAEANVRFDEPDIFGKADTSQEFHTYSLLPPEAMLDSIRASDGYLGVPWGLVKSFPEFFTAAKEAGVQVAVFGFTSESDQEEKQAVALGANLVITDHPTIVD